MDATSGDRSRWRRRRRGRRHRRERSQSPISPSPPPSPPSSSPPSPPSPPQRSESLPVRFVQYVENKMGLPPPYEQSQPNPAPPPSYFGDNPPPPAGFVTPAAAPRTTVITNPTPATGPGTKIGPGPTGTTCASCNRSIVTRVDYVPNNRTHIVSAALCVLAGCCCGCFIPYCMRSCKTANHYCPKCRAFIGSYTPS